MRSDCVPGGLSGSLPGVQLAFGGRKPYICVGFLSTWCVMDRQAAIETFSAWARGGRVVYTLRDLRKLFRRDSAKTLEAALQRLVADGVLQRACRGVYVYVLERRIPSDLLERIAVALRRGAYNYVSLESALSEYGAISQVPTDRLTVMTSGRKGVYRTPWGTIEFTHTKRATPALLDSMRDVERALRLATPEAAWRDLKRVGRNTHLVNEAALAHG